MLLIKPDFGIMDNLVQSAEALVRSVSAVVVA